MKSLTLPPQQDANFYRQIVDILEQGGVIAFPTDTIYGLGVDACNSKAIRKIYEIKNRKAEKPLTLFVGRRDRIKDFAFVKFHKIIDSFMPGPLAIVLWAKENAPALSTDQSIGIRIPQTPWLQELIVQYGRPLATSSANLSEAEPLVSPEAIVKAMPGIDLIIDDGPRESPPSTLLDLRSNYITVLRKGKIPILEMEKTVNRILKLGPTTTFNILLVCTGNSCRSPMAQALLRLSVPDPRIIIDSCGTAAPVGRSATDFAQQVVKNLGTDLSSHKTKPITRALINQSDLVLCMELRHFETVIELLPAAATRTFLFKEYKRGQVMNNEVLDPIGQDLQTYELCAKSMLPSLKVLVREMEKRLDP